ncbi:MAG: hypothetical protein GKS06_03835 [Acidobacteria bacterium]|nr:hypothetical protein [Acidobacteriota bacterium]
MTPSPTAAPTRGRLIGRHALGVLRAVTALLVIAFLALWYVLETDAAAERVREFIESRATAATGQPTNIGRLELDVIPPRVEMHDILVGDPESPLAAADRVLAEFDAVELMARQITLENIELDRPIIDLAFPLTGAASDAGVTGLDITIHRARVTEGEFRVANASAGVAGEVFGVELQLDPEGVGRLGLGTGRGGGRLRIDRGQLDLTGRNGPTALVTPLELNVDYRVRPGVANLDGARLFLGSSSIEVEGVWRGTDNVDFQVQGDLALEDLFHIWVPPGNQDHGGRARFFGTLQLRDGAAVLAGRLNSDNSRFMGLDVTTFSSNLQVRAGLVELREVQAQLYGGTVQGELSVDSASTPTLIHSRYDAVDIDAATFTDWDQLRGLRLAGVLSGAGELEWAVPFLETARGDGVLSVRLPDFRNAVRRTRADAGEQVVAGIRRSTPALPLPGSLDIEYSVGGGAIELTTVAARLPGATIDLSGRVDFDGALAVDAVLDATDLRTIDQVIAQTRRIASGRSTRYGLRGAGSGQLRLTGTVDRPDLAGAISATDVAIADLRLGRIDAELTTTGPMVETQQLRITRGTGVATGLARLRLPRRGGAVDIAGPDYGVQLRLQDYEANLDLQFAGPEWGAAATLTGDVALQGTFVEGLTGSTNLAGRAVRLGSSGFDSLSLNGRKTVDEWIIEQLDLGAEGGNLTSSIRYDRHDDVIDLGADFAGFPIEALRTSASVDIALGGQLDGSLALGGQVRALDGRGDLSWSNATLDQVPLGAIAARMEARQGRIAAQVRAAPEATPAFPGTGSQRLGAPVESPPGGWAASANFTTVYPYPVEARLTAGADIARTLLTPLIPTVPADVDLSGRAELEITGAVADSDLLRGAGTVTDLRVARGELVVTAPELSVSLDSTEASITGLLRVGDHEVAVGPTIDWQSGALSGALGGTVPAIALHLYDPSLAASGTVALEVELGGTTRAPRIQGSGTLNDVVVDAGWAYPITVASAQFNGAGDQLEVAELEGSIGEHPFRARGSLALDAFSGSSATATSTVAVDVDELDLGPLLRSTPGVERLISGGTVSAAIELAGSGRDPREWAGEVEVSELSARMQQYRIALASPSRARMAGGTLSIADPFRLVGDTTDFELGGTLDLESLDVDLRAVGTIGFEALNVLSPYWGTGGVAELDLRIAGQGGNPTYDGHADLSDVVLSPPVLRQPVEDISARLDFDGRRIRISNGRGALGGGEVAGGGEIFLRDNFPQSFRLDVQVDGAVIRLERDVRFTASADLVHDGTPERSLLSGSVSLTEALYRREYDSESALLDMLDAPETEPNAFLDSINLAIGIQGSESLFIDNNLADVEATIDMEARGTVARPVLLGRASVLSGRLFWNGNNFDVLQGTVEFNNPFETEATFEIRSRTEIRRYTIDMRFSGSLARGVDFDYTSTPTLSDLELFNLLAFGEEPDSTTLQDPDRYQQALGLQATRYLTDAYFSEVESGGPAALRRRPFSHLANAVGERNRCHGTGYVGQTNQPQRVPHLFTFAQHERRSTHHGGVPGITATQDQGHPR